MSSPPMRSYNYVLFTRFFFLFCVPTSQFPSQRQRLFVQLSCEEAARNNSFIFLFSYFSRYACFAVFVTCSPQRRQTLLLNCLQGSRLIRRGFGIILSFGAKDPIAHGGAQAKRVPVVACLLVTRSNFTVWTTQTVSTFASLPKQRLSALPIAGFFQRLLSGYPCSVLRSHREGMQAGTM